MDKALWEMLKHTHIIKQSELKEQDDEQDFEEEGFYTPLESPSWIVIVEKCFEFRVYG